VDTITPKERSALMSRIRGKNTKPELFVRRLLFSMGYRFRVHRRDLPGTPDIVLPKYRLAIFVHGCFFHRHAGCRRAAMPKTRRRYWLTKFSGNVERDRSVRRRLRAKGWNPVVIWECKLHQSDFPTRLRKSIEAALAASDAARRRHDVRTIPQALRTIRTSGGFSPNRM
jgi:DNA mismatch endonuclease (patch repair protein)